MKTPPNSTSFYIGLSEEQWLITLTTESKTGLPFDLREKILLVLVYRPEDLQLAVTSALQLSCRFIHYA